MIIDFCHGPHCVKSIRIRSFSGPYFLTFGMNTERYSVSLRIQSNCGKTRTKKTRNTDTFLAVPNYASGQVSVGSVGLLFIFRGVFRTQFLQKTSIVNFRLHSKYASDTVDTTLWKYWCIYCLYYAPLCQSLAEFCYILCLLKLQVFSLWPANY